MIVRTFDGLEYLTIFLYWGLAREDEQQPVCGRVESPTYQKTDQIIILIGRRGKSSLLFLFQFVCTIFILIIIF